jgi:hypothetical protein
LALPAGSCRAGGGAAAAAPGCATAARCRWPCSAAGATAGNTASGLQPPAAAGRAADGSLTVSAGLVPQPVRAAEGGAVTANGAATSACGVAAPESGIVWRSRLRRAICSNILVAGLSGDARSGPASPAPASAAAAAAAALAGSVPLRAHDKRGVASAAACAGEAAGAAFCTPAASPASGVGAA